MKKIALTAALIISVILAASCVSSPQSPEVAEQPEEAPVPVLVAGPVRATPVIVAASELDLTGAVKYRVKSGDTLVKISRRFYKDGFYYPVILLASKNVKNPDKIWPGMVLTIPDLERNKANDNSRQTIKDCLNGLADLEKTKPRPRRGLINGLKRRADAL